MRQSLAKGTRRALRRAVGTAAVESLTDMEAAINGQGVAVTQVRADVAALARDHAVLKQEYRAYVVAMPAAHLIQPVMVLFQARTFWGRLRWLVTGK